jgi:hypothetical protein
MPTPRSATPPTVARITPRPEIPVSDDSDFVDLGEWLRDTEPTRSTRMQVESPTPTGDEQADFDELLRRFKRGVAENVEAEDYAVTIQEVATGAFFAGVTLSLVLRVIRAALGV